jgi:hypothetical protein
MAENINELVKSIAVDIIGLTTIWAVLNNLNNTFVTDDFNEPNVSLYTTIIGASVSTFIIVKYML